MDGADADIDGDANADDEADDDDDADADRSDDSRTKHSAQLKDFGLVPQKFLP